MVGTIVNFLLLYWLHRKFHGPSSHCEEGRKEVGFNEGMVVGVKEREREREGEGGKGGGREGGREGGRGGRFFKCFQFFSPYFPFSPFLFLSLPPSLLPSLPPSFILALLTAFNLVSFPPLFFFSFLYYTDVWATTLVLASYALSLNNRHIVAALVSE